MRDLGANLLLHPVVEEEDDYYYRARCYRALLDHYPQQTTLLSLLSIPARGAGVREMLWHAVVRRNFGCSHMLWEAGAARGYGIDDKDLQEVMLPLWGGAGCAADCARTLGVCGRQRRF